MDLAGLGDSPVAPGCRENDEYPRDAMENLRAAMDALETKTGARRFIVLGLCSGGDLALKLGYEGDPRVVGVYMLNPRTLCVNDTSVVEQHQKASYYVQALSRQASWKKALRGQIQFRRALELVIPFAKKIVKSRVSALLDRRQNNGAASPTADRVPEGLRKLSERGVDTLLVASEKDPGVDYVDTFAPAAMASLASAPGFHRENMMGMDHTFTALYAQKALSQVLTDHLSQHHL
jgi:dienelactone hydrolase